MSRSEAADHADKRRKLFNQAARWFAEQGYDRASMSGLAVACGVSKGLLYHYFSSKNEILAAIIDAHLSELLDALSAIDEDDPESWIYAATSATLRVYDGADDQHQLQLQALGLLPEDDQQKLRELQRRIVAAFSERIAVLQRQNASHADEAMTQDESELRALTMSLFGMLNWFYLWHRPGRDMDRDDYAKLCARLLVHGLNATSQPDARRPDGEAEATASQTPKFQQGQMSDIVWVPVYDLSAFDPKKDS